LIGGGGVDFNIASCSGSGVVAGAVSTGFAFGGAVGAEGDFDSGATVDFGSVTRFAKFIDFTLSPLTNQTQSGLNFPVLRYADVLLLYAETLNEINGAPTEDAYAAINKVRRRAYGDLLHDLAPALSQSDFRDSVFLERRKEFVQEANRWFDLVRSGTLVQALQNIPAKAPNVSDKNYLYPIPQVEIDLNSLLLPQNPGW